MLIKCIPSTDSTQKNTILSLAPLVPSDFIFASSYCDDNEAPCSGRIGMDWKDHQREHLRSAEISNY